MIKKKIVDLNEYEKFIKEIIVKAGKLTVKYFGKVGVDYTKSGVNDVVTIADLKSQKLITDAIQKKFPEHGIIGEENERMQTNAKYVWYIDPIDGSGNYSRAIPIYGVMIALAKDNVVIMSAIYMPMTKELYFAKKNNGAFLNNKRIYCSKFKKYIDSNGIMGAVWDKNRKNINASIIKNVNNGSVFISTLGSIAVNSCMVSDGRKDWIISDHGGVWDYAAPSLILRESGCTVTNSKGMPWTLKDRYMVAANPALHKELSKVIRKF